MLSIVAPTHSHTHTLLDPSLSTTNVACIFSCFHEHLSPGREKYFSSSTPSDLATVHMACSNILMHLLSPLSPQKAPLLCLHKEISSAVKFITLFFMLTNRNKEGVHALK